MSAGHLVHAQTYPAKPVRVVTSEAGGVVDLVARQISQHLSPALGQAVIVQNKGGGSITAETVAKALPDGYTLLMSGSTLWLLPLMQDSAPYAMRDFEVVTLTHRVPNILVVNPSLPVKSVGELIAYARAKPGGLNYASGASGTSNHLGGELFKQMARVEIVRVPYKGTAPALNAVLAGEVQLMFITAGTAAPHIRSGRLRALSVATLKPSPLAPGIPTVAGPDLPGFQSDAVAGMFVPARTPAAAIARLNREIVVVLQRSDVTERLLALGIDPIGNSAKEAAEAIRSDTATTSKLIREAGIKAD